MSGICVIRLFTLQLWRAVVLTICCKCVNGCNTGQPIRWEGRASKFADYLLKNRLKSRSNGLRIIYSVTINMVSNHLEQALLEQGRITEKTNQNFE